MFGKINCEITDDYASGDFRVLVSLYIKKLKPKLTNFLSVVPLYVHGSDISVYTKRVMKSDIAGYHTTKPIIVNVITYIQLFTDSACVNLKEVIPRKLTMTLHQN